jgi:hypothetical protein
MDPVPVPHTKKETLGTVLVQFLKNVIQVFILILEIRPGSSSSSS